MITKLYITGAFFIVFFFSKAQKFEVVPKIGIQYAGLSYLSKMDSHPSDFDGTVPKLNDTWAFDIKYKPKKFSHIISIESISLGSAFSVRNLYSEARLLPDFLIHKHSDGIDQLLLSYNLQNESRKFLKFIGRNKIKFYYTGGVGIGTNKSKSYYETILKPNSYGFIDDDLYYNHSIRYYRSGIGVFVIGKAGVNFYNKKNKDFLVFEAFWDQGLKQMESFSIDYDYGYFSYPQYQRSIKKIFLKSRGTVFGFRLGVPIRLIK